jgi:hypothetical protein
MRVRRQPQSGPVRFKKYGVGAQLRLGAEALRAYADRLLPPAYDACEPGEVRIEFELRGSEDDGFAVTVGERTVLEHATLSVALTALDTQIDLFIATNTTEVLFVRAGVVSVGGRLLVIPGESFGGTSTLVSELVKTGAAYYSDDFAVFDPDGRVRSYARRRTGDAVPADSAEVGGLLVTRYRPGTIWTPTTMSRGEATLALLANLVSTNDRPERTLSALGQAAAGATALRGDRGEARAMVPDIIRRLGPPV